MARESVSPDPADIRIRDLETKLEEQLTIQQDLESQLAQLGKELEESRAGEQSLLDDLQRMETNLAQERRLVLEREEEILYLQEQLVERVDQEEADRRRQSSMRSNELELLRAKLQETELALERERALRVKAEAQTLIPNNSPSEEKPSVPMENVVSETSGNSILLRGLRESLVSINQQLKSLIK